ncbi:MAG: nucleotidyltransferase domain-containing protein [Actinobacteria bacterium]|nr:nucleotidyltransferase domain-containing protein [Actinomycetota bacterium]
MGGQTQALGVDLVGSYLFGSVVTGDFDPGISDVDTVAVLRSDLTAAQLAALERPPSGHRRRDA